MNYFIEFKKADGTFRVYDASINQIIDMDYLPYNTTKFKMLSGDGRKPTDEDLLKYAKDFKQWCYELEHNSICKIYYSIPPPRSVFTSDYTNITNKFNLFSKKYYKNHTQITYQEFLWYEACPNGSQQYLKDKNITVECYGYDYKSFYALIMASELLIPKCEGKEYHLKKLTKYPEKLKHGFYRVKITCDDDDFRKIFTFSKNDTYLNIDLKRAMQYKKRFHVKIELIIDDKPNAYLYRDEDMVMLSSITSEWFGTMTAIRKLYPKNRLIKHMMSSCWSHINAFNKVFKTFEQVELENIEYGTSPDCDYQLWDIKYYPNSDKEYLELVKTDKPYKHNNLRLKPWITAEARNRVSEMALSSLENIVRVHTDAVMYDKPMKFYNDGIENEMIIPEEKTTGRIHWESVNIYYKVDENGNKIEK